MDPNTKAAFDEILKWFDDFDAHWEQRFTDIKSTVKQETSLSTPM
jgi:hypothetical protein